MANPESAMFPPPGGADLDPNGDLPDAAEDTGVVAAMELFLDPPAPADADAPVQLLADTREILMRGGTPFQRLANGLEDLSAVFEARQVDGGTLSPSMAEHVATTLRHMAELARIGDRQRVAALALIGRPVAEDGVVVVLHPAMPGDRA